MKRIIFISSLLLLLVFGCQKDSGKIPQWLKITIDSISTIQEYEGTTVYRYTWKNEYLYHIEIPISTCTYCELYNQSGTKIIFASDDQFRDFLDNKTDQEVLWEWMEKR
jgi:hypothetical protein